MSLGIETRQVEPTIMHHSHRGNINLLGQSISIDRRALESYNDHAIKRQYISEVSQILFMNYLNINPKFIGSQQTHRIIGLHRIDQSEDAMIIVLKIIREREREIAI